MTLRDRQNRTLEDLANAIDRYHETKHGNDAFLGSTAYGKYAHSRNVLRDAVRKTVKEFSFQEK